MKKGAATVLGLGAALSMTGQSYPPREQEKYIASSKEKRWKRWRNHVGKTGDDHEILCTPTYRDYVVLR